MTLNEYQRANLRWLLQGCKRNFPQLDTGDWFLELMHMTEGVDVYPNANADAFDHVIKGASEYCPKCNSKAPLYSPPHDDGTYQNECGRCLLKERDKLQGALDRLVHELGIAKKALDGS